MCGAARGREGVLAEMSEWVGGRTGVCGDQTHPVAAEYIYMVYMTMTRDCDCGGATARRSGRLGGGDGKTELFALYVTEKNPGYCLIENPR